MELNNECSHCSMIWQYIEVGTIRGIGGFKKRRGFAGSRAHEQELD